MSSYIPRVIDDHLAKHLRLMPAVVLQGPKGCGKTTTASQLSASKATLDAGPDAALARTDPMLVLPGDTPRLLDEWQVVDGVWNAVRHEVDRRDRPGQFLLAGSARPTDDPKRHSGAGRFATVTMRNLSLRESGDSTGDVSLSGLLDGADVAPTQAPSSVQEVVDMLCKGGLPRTVSYTVSDAQEVLASYVESVGHDAASLGKQRDPERVRALLTSIAKHTSTDVKVATLAKDAPIFSGAALSTNTATEYLGDLARMMVVEPQPAWGPHLRSRARVRGTAKMTWCDPALAIAALRVGPEALLKDVSFLGLLVENLVVRDIRVYAESRRAQVSHYRDSNGLEIDVIVSTPQGSWLAIEVKLGSSKDVVDHAAHTLTKFAKTVDTARVGEPAGLIVITASGSAYTRSDGVRVVPITTLGP